MKCPNCGAETKGNFCEYCGSELNSQEPMKETCSRCGSVNIAFKREKQGEILEKRYRQTVYRTVGYCKDCGNTWIVAEEIPKKRRTWLWVLGWIFVFPVPLAILLLRKKDMNPILKYGIIAVACLVWCIWVFSSGSGVSDSEDLSETINQEELQIYYEDDEIINLYVNRFNECNPDYLITVDDLQKYYHHGAEHDDQVIFYRDGFEIIITDPYGSYNTNKTIEVYIGYTSTAVHTNDEYGAMFVKFAKAYNPILTEEELQSYWQKIIDDPVSVTDLDIFECTKSPSVDETISYFTINGELE